MSEQELKQLRDKLNNALETSYEKMLQLKMKLGQEVVLSDPKGNVTIITAEEAWGRYVNGLKDSTVND